MYMYIMCIHLSLSIYLSLYTYIYIYIYSMILYCISYNVGYIIRDVGRSARSRLRAGRTWRMSIMMIVILIVFINSIY